MVQRARCGEAERAGAHRFACELLGYEESELRGQNVRMLMPEPYAREHTGYIQRYLRTGDAKVIGIGREVQARRKDGSLFPADLAISAFHDVKPLFTGILRDISDRKTMEADVLPWVMQEHLWMPVLNINMDEVVNKKVKGARPHMIYQNTFYKGLDASF